MSSAAGRGVADDVESLRRQLEEYERWYRTFDRQNRILERERQKLAAIVNHTDAGFIVLDSAMSLVWANEGFRSRFACAPGSKPAGQRCNDALCGADEICEGCPVPVALATGQVAHHELTLELHGQPKHIYATAMPIHSPEGRVDQCVLMLQDVSDLAILRRSEEALRASEERFRSIFENVPAGMYSTKLDGSFLQVNPAFCAMVGYPAEILIASKNAFDLIHRDDRPELQRQLNGVLTGRRRVLELEHRYCRSDGGVVWGRSTAVWPLDRGPTPTYAVVLVQDVTDRKRAQVALHHSWQVQRQTERALREKETELQHVQKMEAIGRLAGGIAHDFNNLLTAIAGYSLLVRDRLPAAEGPRAEIEEVIKAASRAAVLTGQLLAFSRRQVLLPRLLNLNSVVADVHKMLERIIGEDVELSTRLASDLGCVRADPGQMQQVLINLAVNARDAMPAGGRIVIETRNIDEDGLGPSVMLTFADDGAGMDAETLAKAFEPFFTTKEQGKGTGLGLAMVYGIVKQSGGTIAVDSAIGTGTIFRLCLPRINGVAADLVEPHIVATPARGAETVLLVEDDDAVRGFAAEVLTDAGYTVLSASNGWEAISLPGLHDRRIQLLVTDIVMPRMGGVELAKTLAVSQPEMRVLYVSGYTDSAVFQEGLLDRSLHFMQKPFTPMALAAKVREVLDTASR